MSVEIHLPGATTALPARLDGVVIGVLLDVPDAAAPVVAYPGCPSEHGLAAATTTQLSRADIGALLVEALAQLDGERLEFSAEREIVLRCGKASITLTRAGKVIIRGAYLSSRSTGVNRIKGGSVQIN